MNYFFSALRWAQESTLWILGASCVLQILGEHLSAVRLALLVIPPALRLFLYIRDRITPAYDTFSNQFPKEAAAALISGLICHYSQIRWGLPAALIFLITSVFLLRMLRQAEAQILTPLSMTMEILLAAVLCTVSLIFSRPAVFSTILDSLGLGVRILLTPIFYALAAVIYGILWVGAKVLALLGIGKEVTEHRVIIERIEAIPFREGERQLIGQNPWPARIGSVILVLLVIIIAVLWIRRLLRQRRSSDGVRRADPLAVVRSRADLTSARSDRVAVTDRSPRAKVRRTYARFTRTLQENGHFPDPWDTSREIQEHHVPADLREPASRLREIYLRARYDADAVITDAEAAEAAALERQVEAHFHR